MAEITWIKLKTNMFDNDKIKLIEALPEADTILIIWIKLLAAAGKANSNGYIMLTENIPMNIEEMATIFGRPLNTVRLAIQTFKSYGMIDMDENEVIRIANWEKHQNINGMEHVKKLNAERNRRYRERKKQQQLAAPKGDKKEDVSKETTPLPPNDNTDNVMRDVMLTSRDGTDLDLDKDLDLDLDLDKDLDIDKESQVVGQSLPHSNNDFIAIRNLFEQHVRIATFKDCEKINEAMEFYETTLILEAVKAGASSARSFNYILGILDNWRKEFDVKTYADWKLKIQRKGGQPDASSRQPNGANFNRTPEEMDMLAKLRNYTS